MTTLATTPATAPRLRLWFAADAAVSGANAVLYLVAAGPIADLLGGDATAYRVLGGFLAVFAAGVALYARGPLRPAAGWTVVGANAVWVAASLDVALTGALGLDTAGRVWAVAQALVVAELALMQARGLRRR